MRIVSKFRDYYDCIQATGQDQSLVYVREEIEEDWSHEIKLGAGFPPPPSGRGRYYFYRSNLCYCHEYMVGFCGKIYPCLALQKQAGDDPTFCYSTDDVVRFVEANYNKREIDSFHSNESKGRIKRPWPFGARLALFKKYFEECQQQTDKANPAAFKHPIFVRDMQSKWVNGKYRIPVTWNACLRPYEFFRVLDPYTAFQELQMYFGSLAVPQKPIPVPSDKDMVVAKGFDKWSFRKPPQK